MVRPKTSERRKPGNAELRSAMGAIELWIRHAAVKNSGVIKVTHHELVTIHDALVLALREDNPQSLLILDTDVLDTDVLDTGAGTEVRKDSVEEAPKKKKGRKRKKAANIDKKYRAVVDESTEVEVPAEAEPEIDPGLDLDLGLGTDSPDTSADDEDKT